MTIIPCERAESRGCTNEATVIVRMHSKYVDLRRPFCRSCADAEVERTKDVDPTRALKFEIVEEIAIPETMWVHTLSYHTVGSVVGWPSYTSPTGYWSGIVREIGQCSVRVDAIQPARVK